MWDRSKQKHWIYTHDKTWKVLNFQTNEYVCDIAPMHDKELHTKICFSENIDEIKQLSEESLKEFEKQKIFFDMVEKSRPKH